MDAPHLSLADLRHSPLTRVIALLALASQLGCYRTWTESVAPPPLADSITWKLRRDNTVSVFQPVPGLNSAVDTLQLTLSQDHTVTLLRPELEGDSVLWGWTQDNSLKPQKTLVTSTGVETVPGPDSVRVRVSMIETHRELQGGKTALLATGVVLSLGLVVYGFVFSDAWANWHPLSGDRTF